MENDCGRCSVCGSDMVEYGSSEHDGDSIGYEISCSSCGAQGMEWYDVVYSETIMHPKEDDRDLCNCLTPRGDDGFSDGICLNCGYNLN